MTRRPHGLDELRRDLAFAVRGLVRNPSFTLVAVLTLALGIGANTAIFSVVEGVLLAPIPLARPGELVVVWETDRASGTVREPASVPDYLDFTRRSRTLAALSAVMGGRQSLAAQTGEPERVNTLRVTPGYFAMVGARPLLGRGFEPAEGAGSETAGADVVALGERFWRARFAADRGVIGRTVRLDGRAATVVGVLPESAGFGIGTVLGRADYGNPFAEGEPTEIDVWLPLHPDPVALPRETHPILQLGRLAPGVGIAAAQDELAAIASDLEAAYPENDAHGVHLESLSEAVLGPVRPALLVLLGAVALLLLAACVNVANLFLARGTARGRELALRTALGATPGRLAWQFLAESALLTALATAAGLGVAFAGLRLLLALAPADLPRIEAVGIDTRVLAATAGLAVVVALAFALVPLAQARSRDLEADLGRAAGGGDGRSRVRGALVVAEVALATLLAIGATLLVHSFWRLSAVDPGFRTEGVLRAEVELPEVRYPRDFATWPAWPAHHRFVTAVLGRLEARPDVEAAAVAGANPLAAGFTNSWAVVGREAESRDWPEISMRLVTPGYFATVELPVLEGRGLEAGDDARAPRVALVNRAAERRYFSAGSPVAEQIVLWGQRWRIVGVVADEHIHGLDAPAPPAAYLALDQAPTSSATILVRTGGDPAALAGPVRRAVAETDPQLAVFDVEPLRATRDHSLAARRFSMTLLAAFAGVALFLAVLGVHGVLSYGVARRAPELGIRMALGASRRRVVGTVVRQGLTLAALGLLLGLPAAAGLGRLIAALLFETTPYDPRLFAGVAAAILGAAALASWLPARRAARADPAAVLRSE